MAAYVSPAHLATTLQFDRIEDAARREAPVLEILNAGSATTVKAVKRAFLSLSKQIHPHRGGNFDPVRATSAQVIVARGFEQAKRAAEFDSFKNADYTWTSNFDPEFVIPGNLLFSPEESDEEEELLKAQQDAEEAEVPAREAAQAVAEALHAARAARGYEEDSDAAGGDGSDDGGGGDDDADSGDTTPGAGLAALFVAVPCTPIPDVAAEKFPEFDGVPFSAEHKAHIVESKKFYRTQQVRRAKSKAKVVAKNRLAAAKLESLSWLPLSFEDVPTPEIGLVFQQRWQAEQFVRSWTAKIGVQTGVQLKIALDSMRASCSTCSGFCMVLHYQPKSGQWVLRKFVDHHTGCFGAPTPADGATAKEAACVCKSAFTATQVARLVLNSPLIDLDGVNLSKIRGVVSTCYSRLPSNRFLGSVKNALATSMRVDREVDMAALPGYAAALVACGHQVTPPRSRPCCLLFRSPSSWPLYLLSLSQ